MTKRGPAKHPAKHLDHSEPPSSEGSRWFLHYDQSQYGPFLGEEVADLLQRGKLHGGVYAWKEGMEDWVELEHIDSFAADVKAARKVRDAKKKGTIDLREENRDSPRKPLVARILLSNQETVILGVCRDISIGGMQILTDRIPGKVGQKIRINVSPSRLEGSEEPLPAFVTEGVIVRILDDGKGFSFRFEKLEPAARAAIELYVLTPRS